MIVLQSNGLTEEILADDSCINLNLVYKFYKSINFISVTNDDCDFLKRIATGEVNDDEYVKIVKSLRDNWHLNTLHFDELRIENIDTLP